MSKKVADSVIISALLKHGTQEEAAKSVGITPQTIINRMKNPDFVKKYHDAQNELLRGTTRKLSNASGRSVDLLVDTLNDPEVNIRLRVSIANDILRLQRDFTLLDELQRRISVLESKQNEQTEQVYDSNCYIPNHDLFKPLGDSD